jgi:hypothetical protein
VRFGTVRGTVLVDEQLIETWNNHNQINLFVLDALTP